MEQNVTSQAEEIEALCSIYESQWKTEDEATRSYSIEVVEGTHHVTLYVTLPPEYPSDSPPVYLISAPDLNQNIKMEISNELENLYLENIGENIIYQWIEKIKEILQSKFGLHATEEEEETVSKKKHKRNKQKVVQETLVVPLAVQVPDIIHGEIITDRKSTFQGHVATITSVEEVRLVMSALLENKKIENATHNIYAYRICVGQCMIQDCEDDGETQAGGRLLHLLQIVDAKNVMVVVSRWYGGIHLGSDRFRHINNAARQVLELAGHISKKK